jgi:hypothetical protein
MRLSSVRTKSDLANSSEWARTCWMARRSEVYTESDWYAGEIVELDV